MFVSLKDTKEWIIFLFFVCVTYAIGILGIKIYNKCPDEDLKKYDTHSASTCIIVSNTLLIFAILALLFWKKGKYSDFSNIFTNYHPSNQEFPLLICILILMSISLVTSFASEIQGSKNISNCDFLKSGDAHKIKEFVEQATAFERLYGIVMFGFSLFILYFLFIVFSVSKDGITSSFGRGHARKLH